MDAKKIHFSRLFSVTGMITLLAFVSSCSIYSLYTSHKVCHAGFSVEVPGDWGDYTETNKNELAVARIWGSTGLTIAKLPGQFEFDLALRRKAWVSAPNTGSEEVITNWFGFQGHGIAMHRLGNEGVLFCPEGEYSGFYFDGVISEEKGSQASFSKVIHSLKREVSSNGKR